MKQFLLYVVLFKISGTISHHVANQPNSFYLFEVLVLLGTVVGTTFDGKNRSNYKEDVPKEIKGDGLVDKGLVSREVENYGLAN
jgi:hypothetical protein